MSVNKSTRVVKRCSIPSLASCADAITVVNNKMIKSTFFIESCLSTTKIQIFQLLIKNQLGIAGGF